MALMEQKMKETHFNSHAHVERDIINERRATMYGISTHTLTWSVTSKRIFAERL